METPDSPTTPVTPDPREAAGLMALPGGEALHADTVIIARTGSGGSALAAAISARVLALDPAPHLVVISNSSSWALSFPQAQVLTVDFDSIPEPREDELVPKGFRQAADLIRILAIEAERRFLLNRQRTLLVMDDAWTLVWRLVIPFPLSKNITTITQVQDFDDLTSSPFGRLLLDSASTFWFGTTLPRDTPATLPGGGPLPGYRQRHGGEEGRDFLLVHPRAGLERAVLVRREDVPGAFLRRPEGPDAAATGESPSRGASRIAPHLAGHA